MSVVSLEGDKTEKLVGVCTIIAKNYLPYARTLMQSVKRFNPDFKCFVLLADQVDGYFEPEQEDFILELSSDLPIPENSLFHFKYNVLELCTAVKPFYLEKLLAEHKLDKLFYFDPDIMVFDELSPLVEALDRSSIILTPHLLAPLSDGKRPGEREIMQAGAYNLGFIGIAGAAKTLPFLKWWQERLYNDCVVDIAGNLFVDQRWVDLVPGLFCEVEILRDPGFNVAYWNLNGREITLEDGRYRANGQPLRFFHFSGFDAEHPENFSRHQDRFATASLGEVNGLLELYSRTMLENGYSECRKWPYFYAIFSDRSIIPDFCRRMVRDDVKFQASLRGKSDLAVEAAIFDYMNEPYQPGETSRVLISRLLYYIYNQRKDLRENYPDIARTHRLDIVHWYLSAAETEYKIPARFITLVAESLAEREAAELNIIRQYNYKQQSEESAAYARQLEAAFRELQNSPSWKLTAPLRKLAAFVRR